MSELVKREAGADVASVERTRTGTTYVPRFDIVEHDDELVLYGDLPGVAPDALEIRFENSHLMIEGNVAPRHQDHEFLYGEYGIGNFYREFQISEAIDNQKIAAELKNGVLKVTLPKAESVKPRRIEVKAS
jgi:HSP20 family protein